MKSLVLHYPTFQQNIELKTTFQINKLHNVLIDQYENTGNCDEFLEYDIDKINKVCISLKQLNAVTPVIEPRPETNPHTLELTFTNGAKFEIKIWGDKRARNAYYLFLDQMKKPELQKYFKIPQTDKKHFSLICIQDTLQFVKLHEPKSETVALFEDKKTWNNQNL